MVMLTGKNAKGGGGGGVSAVSREEKSISLVNLSGH